MREVTGLFKGFVLKERYVILSLLGKGGMGKVYLAQDLRLEGKYWAIKEVKMEIENDVFIDEARMLAALDHPNLPKIVDYYPPDSQGYCFIVMDYIQGSSIADYYEKLEEKLSAREILQYMIELCGVFQYLHNQKPHPIIYRDLKPSNVMLDQNKKVYLIDFGIARLFQQDKSTDTIQIGTVGFAAPEQYANQQTDQRTDIFQLGALLQYFLTGSPYLNVHHSPFSYSVSPEEARRRGEKESRVQLDQNAYDGIMSIVHKATQYLPEDRYSLVEEMLEALQALQHQLEEAKKPNHTSKTSVRAIKDGAKSKTVSSPIPSPAEQLSSKYILIGSLWNGAGATTLATLLARSLAAKEFSVAYVEYPSLTPYMYDYLNISGQEAGSRKAERGMESFEQKNFGFGQAWDSHDITWYVNHPERIRADCTYEELLKLTHYLRHHTCTIIDVANQWLQPSIMDFLEQADYVYLCIEPDPVKIDWLCPLESRSTGEHSLRLKEDLLWPKEGNGSMLQALSMLLNAEMQGKCNLELISMKMNDLIHSKKWQECLFKQPLASIPYLPFPQLMNHAWNSTFIYDQAEYQEDIERALQPILKQLVSHYLSERGRNKVGARGEKSFTHKLRSFLDVGKLNRRKAKFK